MCPARLELSTNELPMSDDGPANTFTGFTSKGSNFINYTLSVHPSLLPAPCSFLHMPCLANGHQLVSAGPSVSFNTYTGQILLTYVIFPDS